MKNSIDFIQKPKAGEPITESLLASLIDSVNQLKSQIRSEKAPEYVNPSVVRCVNGLAMELPIFSIVHLDNATITDNSFFNSSGGGTQDSRVYATKPNGEENEPFGIIRSHVGPSFEVSAVCSGFSCCKIKVDNSTQENYKYAKPVQNETGYLQASETGPCRIVWKEDGIGTKWGYVIIDRTVNAEQAKCADNFTESYLYPEGAHPLEEEDTWTYCDDLDSFGTEDDSNAPSVYNPLGLPMNRRTIIAKCYGFPGEAEPSGSRAVGEYVAISNDIRDYVDLTTSNLSTIDSIKSSQNYILEAGDCIYVRIHSSHSKWVYGASEYDDCRLVVCQRSIPKGWSKTFRMPFYPVESNIGVCANRTLVSSERAYYIDFGYRCGISPTGTNSVSMTNQQFDYEFKGGRYLYNPRFRYHATAVNPSSITVSSSDDIVGYGNNAFEKGLVAFQFLDGNYYTAGGAGEKNNGSTFCPDVWEGDALEIEVDCSFHFGTPRFKIVKFQYDFPEGFILPSYSFSIANVRGWVQATHEDTYGKDIGSDGGNVLALYTTHNYGHSGTDLSDYIDGQSPSHTSLSRPEFKSALNIYWWKKTKEGALV